MTPDEHLKSFLATKRALRLEAIRLPFEEKLKRVIQMQILERDLKKDKTKKVYVWSL